jgi:hypothetical protein
MSVNNNNRFDHLSNLNMYTSMGFYSNKVLEVETINNAHL